MDLKRLRKEIDELQLLQVCHENGKYIGCQGYRCPFFMEESGENVCTLDYVYGGTVEFELRSKCNEGKYFGTIEDKIMSKTKPQTLKGGEDVHEFCKRCGESKARTIDGEGYIVCEKASDMVCVSMKECPLGKWICEDIYIILP